MEKSIIVITEPAAMAALKQIYETNGPGNLMWDFSTAGQVAACDGRLFARDGTLTGLNLNQAGLKAEFPAKYNYVCKVTEKASIISL